MGKKWAHIQAKLKKGMNEKMDKQAKAIKENEKKAEKLQKAIQ